MTDGLVAILGSLVVGLSLGMIVGGFRLATSLIGRG